MSFPERAVKVLVQALEREASTTFQVNMVLRCGIVDVSAVEPFLDSSKPMVRQVAAEVVGKKGDANKVVQAILKEQEEHVRLAMMEALGERPADYAPLYGLASDEDDVVRDAAMRLFRRTKQNDPLFTMLFSDDEAEVNRAKRYMDAEQED